MLVAQACVLTLAISESGKTCALISKVFPTRSHTVSAQGGITVALGNSHEDNWQWHMYDTVKGSDYIGDQDAIEYMTQTGPEAITELENMGLPFSRFENGRVYQRPFGGQSKNFGGEQAARTAAAADRTGHALLHCLYQQNVKNQTNVFSEWYALDLVKNDKGDVVGCTAIQIETGEVVYFKSKAVVLATGGAGRIYASTTNAHIKHRRWCWYGCACWYCYAGYGNVAIPPNRYCRCWYSRYRKVVVVKVVIFLIKMVNALWSVMRRMLKILQVATLLHVP